MLKRRFSNKSDIGKPENNIPDNQDMDIENMEAEAEEMAETGMESNLAPELDSETNEITDLQKLEEEVAALQKESADAQDKYLRLAAEFDNYRKRTLREKTELIQTAGESLLKDMLPVVDDFERGLTAVSKAEDLEAVMTGMELIYSKLTDFLTNHGVKEINAMSEPFDADWHEAVTNIPAPTDDMKGKIMDVIQKGYTLNDKIIRYPKVVVGE